MSPRPTRPVRGRVHGPLSPVPELSLLGDERYSLLVTAAGGGVSRSGGVVLNRWRNDGTRDAHGQWCYLKNVGNGHVWSAGHQPVCAPHLSYEAELGGDRATIRRRDDEIETLTEITALPGGSGEARRISITNHSGAEVELEITSYQEVVLAPAVADRGHRAFGNLFVQTEKLRETAALLAMRRPRSAGDAAAWCGHTLVVPEGNEAPVSCETDRARFIGRGRSTRNPAAMDNPGNLSGTTGAVLDPILSLRATLYVPARDTASVAFTTFAAVNRDEAVRLARRYSGRATTGAAFSASLREGDPVARDMELDRADTELYHSLASRLVYGTGRIPAGTRDDMLALGLTGERPVMLARLDSGNEFGRVSGLLSLSEYLRRKGVAMDLVLICGDPGLEREIIDRVPPRGETRDPGILDRQGILVTNEPGLGPAAVALLESLARVSVDRQGDWRSG